jgi:hypothetical protein
VKPPGFDGGEPIKTTTMHNQVVHTKAPQVLIDVTPVSGVCTYDPKSLADIRAQINVNQSITTWYPDYSAVAFWGYLQKFEPTDNSDTTQPEANFTIIPTNADLSQVEQLPLYFAAVGTSGED